MIEFLKIRVILHGEFGRSITSELNLDLPKGTDVRQLLAEVAKFGGRFRQKVYDSSGKMLKNPVVTIKVNNSKAIFDRILTDGDVVSIFPISMVAGG